MKGVRIQMGTENIKLEIADLLGYCDLNGVEALDSEQVERLEDYIYKCNEAMSNVDGVPLVADAVYDKMCEILKQVNPDAEVLGEVWGDDAVSEEDLQEKDIFKLLRAEPMRSICTCKSFDCEELKDFVDRLPDGDFDAHISCKENGHGIRIVYCYGLLEDATSRARSSAGHNITRQLGIILGRDGLDNLEDLCETDIVEIRGEVVLPFSNLNKARSFNPEIVSAFSGVSSMLRDSATEEETNLLSFVAYKAIIEGVEFATKEEEYTFLENLGFTTPLSWVVPGLNKETLLDELPAIVADCEAEVKPDENGTGGYEFYTDGLVFEVNDRAIFKAMGSDGKKYNYGNVALKVGYWQQDLYSGFIQTILWTDGKTKYSPVAIIGDDIDMATYEDGFNKPYITSIKEIDNWKELGVVTAGGNKVRRVPLYEPNNMVLLNAYVGELINFRYGGEAGVVPCFPDGTPLSMAKIKNMMSGAESWDDDDDTDGYF